MARQTRSHIASLRASLTPISPIEPSFPTPLPPEPNAPVPSASSNPVDLERIESLVASDVTLDVTLVPIPGYPNIPTGVSVPRIPTVPKS
jgi:hypothetical protein